MPTMAESAGVFLPPTYYIRTGIAVDDNIRIVRVVSRVIDGQVGFALVDGIGTTSTVTRMMILMAEPGRQADVDGDHEHGSGNAAGDAQHRPQIRRFHYDWGRGRKRSDNRTETVCYLTRHVYASV